MAANGQIPAAQVAGLVDLIDDRVDVDVAPVVLNQTTPASEWVFNHGLGYLPDVRLFIDPDLTEQVFTQLIFVDDNTVLVEWPSPQSGKAYAR